MYHCMFDVCTGSTIRPFPILHIVAVLTRTGRDRHYTDSESSVINDRCHSTTGSRQRLNLEIERLSIDPTHSSECAELRWT